jgi:hypothetical protein
MFETWLQMNKHVLTEEREAIRILCKFLQHETSNQPHPQVLVTALNVLMLTQPKSAMLVSSSVPLLVRCPQLVFDSFLTAYQ